MPAFLSNGIFISEVFADNIGATGFDTDGDGVINKADEYVELQFKDRTGAGSVSLDGIEIWTAKRGQIYSFANGNSIASGDVATVIGQYDGVAPAGFYDAGLPDNNSNQGLLEDGENTRFDTIYIVDTNTGEYISFAYGEPPQIQALPPGFPGTISTGAESLNTGFPNGVPVRRDANGDFAEIPPPTPGTPGPPCFVAGTYILTPTGPARVQDLKAGDLVVTADQGIRPILWTGRTTCHAMGQDAPVALSSGAFGVTRRLMVSQQHRILLSGAEVELLFDAPKVWCAAKYLTGHDHVTICEGGMVTYHHILLSKHAVLIANGCESKSFHLGHMAQAGIAPNLFAAISARFPQQIQDEPTSYPTLKKGEAVRLLDVITPKRLRCAAETLMSGGKITVTQ